MTLNNNFTGKITSLLKEIGLPPYLYANRKFIGGQTPILYNSMYWDEEEIKEALNAFLCGKWVSAGENVRKFENQFAHKIKDQYGIMTNSGSSSNLILMGATKELRNWKNGSEIIVSVVGFPTTIAPIVQNGLNPVFIDIEMDTLNFNVDIIEENITDKTVAILLSPVLGNPPDIDKILSLCSEYHLDLLLDCCDSLGSKWNDTYLNQYALASAHSFYASHTLSCGEGGMLTTSNAQLAKIARSLISWGRDCYCYGEKALSKDGTCNKRFSKWLKNYDGIVDHKYVFNYMGYNLKPLDLQGAIGIAQMNKFDDIIKKRHINKETIGQIFENNVDDIYIPKELSKSYVSWFGTPVVCKDRNLKNKLVQFLENNLIQTRNYFAGNILLHDGYAHLGDWRKYSGANKVLDLVFFVGAAPFYNQEIFDYIDKSLKEFSNDQ